MRRLTLLAALVLLAPLGALVRAQPLAPAPFARTLSADTLAQVGAARPAQAVDLLDWSAATVDGLSVDARPLSALPGVGSSPLLVLDGLPVYGLLFGGSDPNRLPVDLALVGGVAATSGPARVAGVWAPAGYLAFRTRPVPLGFGAAAGGWAANGTGDPGPYQYVDPSLPNAERIGPDAFAAASFGSGRGWFGRAHGVTRRQGIIAEAVSPRLATVFESGGGTPQLRATSGSVEVGRTGRGGHHTAGLLLYRADEFVLLEPIGRELPASHRAWTLRASGEQRLGAQVDMRYGAVWSRAAADARPGSRTDLTLDRREARTHTFAQVHATRGAARGLVGLSWTVHRGASAEGARREEAARLPAVYAEAQGARGSLALAAGGHVTLGARVAPVAWTRAAWRPASRLSLAAQASGGYRLFEATPSLWQAHGAGYDLLRRAGVRVEAFEPSTRSRYLHARFDLTARLSASASASAGAFAHAGGDLTLVDQPFAFDPASQGVAGPARVTGGHAGVLWGGRSSVEGRLGRYIRARAGYAFALPRGDALFVHLARRQPPHRLTLRAGLHPDDRFALTALLRVDGATRWSDYADAAAGSEGRYVDRLPARAALDVTARKRLWGPRLDGSVTVRNLLGRDLRTHPLGLSQPTSLGVRVLLRLE